MAKYIINVPDEIIEFMDGKFDVLIEPEVKVGECRHYKVRLDDTEITPYTEQDRKAVEDEVWDFILELVARHRYEVDDCFGTDSMCEIMSSIPYSEAKSIYETWKAEKAKKAEIRVGDEVIPLDTQYDTMVATKLWTSEFCDEWVDTIAGDGKTYHFLKTSINKTGRHFDELEELLRKVNGD